MVFKGEEITVGAAVMTTILDRRSNGKNKSAVNRQRFLQRYKNQIKDAVSHAIKKRNITDIEKGEKVSISSDELIERRIQHGSGGWREVVLPGNKHFNAGDKVQRQNSASGKNTQAGQGGTGEDTFVFDLSRDEFLELYFEDLELPKLIQKELCNIKQTRTKRAGITTTGVPTNINVIRTLRQALSRRIALRSAKLSRIEQLRKLEKQIKRIIDENRAITHDEILNLYAKYHEHAVLSEDFHHRSNRNPIQIENNPSNPIEKNIEFLWGKIQSEIKSLEDRLLKIPFIDEVDIRYNNRVKVNEPATKAVMFCIMDVSGSMDEEKKELAKRFFILLYLFLTRTYENIELVFIRHHTAAKRVNEEEFFYSRETGGTVVSSALELTRDLIKTEYNPNNWNIYVAQASDGDNWNADSPYCKDLIFKELMPHIQYYTYIEIMPRHHQSLWDEYTAVAETFKNFAMKDVDSVSDIYPVFRELFKRQKS